MDVDHFKECNDTHGHAFGDTVLRAVADEIAAEVRAEDIVARVGETSSQHCSRAPVKPMPATLPLA